MFEETRSRLIGLTESPSRWATAMRPCMAETEARLNTPVQSPAAYTLLAVVRETPSTRMCPESVSCTPASSRPRPLVFGIEPTATRQWLPSSTRPSARVTSTLSPWRVTASARAWETTFRPLRLNTSSSTPAASASSPGRTRSREDTRVTLAPSRL